MCGVGLNRVGLNIEGLNEDSSNTADLSEIGSNVVDLNLIGLVGTGYTASCSDCTTAE